MAELAQSREDYLDNDGDDENEHEVMRGERMGRADHKDEKEEEKLERNVHRDR